MLLPKKLCFGSTHVLTSSLPLYRRSNIIIGQFKTADDSIECRPMHSGMKGQVGSFQNHGVCMQAFPSFFPPQPLPTLLLTSFFAKVLAGVYMRKLTPARVSYWDDFLISYYVYMMTGSFHITLFEGTLHVDKIHVCLKIANITYALPIPVYRQTNFNTETGGPFTFT